MCFKTIQNIDFPKAKRESVHPIGYERFQCQRKPTSICFTEVACRDADMTVSGARNRAIPKEM